ncbi:MAG: TIGR03905 family TSCPD domain-containing protein [Oscillospiraceae bacterium]|nr:TIGR03905 family TSCPD domain-containing protein [Oscillospiraceae bacterium]
MKYVYSPQGVCSEIITVDVEDGIIRSLQVIGGCNGNLKGIAELLKGMDVEDAILRLKGIQCGMRPTSCPDQIAGALEQLQVLQQAV